MIFGPKLELATRKASHNAIREDRSRKDAGGDHRDRLLARTKRKRRGHAARKDADRCGPQHLPAPTHAVRALPACARGCAYPGYSNESTDLVRAERVGMCRCAIFSLLYRPSAFEAKTRVIFSFLYRPSTEERLLDAHSCVRFLPAGRDDGQKSDTGAGDTPLSWGNTFLLFWSVAPFDSFGLPDGTEAEKSHELGLFFLRSGTEAKKSHSIPARMDAQGCTHVRGRATRQNLQVAHAQAPGRRDSRSACTERSEKCFCDASRQTTSRRLIFVPQVVRKVSEKPPGAQDSWDREGVAYRCVREPSGSREDWAPGGFAASGGSAVASATAEHPTTLTLSTSRSSSQ